MASDPLMEEIQKLLGKVGPHGPEVRNYASLNTFIRRKMKKQYPVRNTAAHPTRDAIVSHITSLRDLVKSQGRTMTYDEYLTLFRLYNAYIEDYNANPPYRNLALIPTVSMEDYLARLGDIAAKLQIQIPNPYAFQDVQARIETAVFQRYSFVPFARQIGQTLKSYIHTYKQHKLSFEKATNDIDRLKILYVMLGYLGGYINEYEHTYVPNLPNVGGPSAANLKQIGPSGSRLKQPRNGPKKTLKWNNSAATTKEFFRNIPMGVNTNTEDAKWYLQELRTLLVTLGIDHLPSKQSIVQKVHMLIYEVGRQYPLLDPMPPPIQRLFDEDVNPFDPDTEEYLEELSEDDDTNQLFANTAMVLQTLNEYIRIHKMIYGEGEGPVNAGAGRARKTRRRR